QVYLTNMFPDYEPPEELQCALSQAAIVAADIFPETGTVEAAVHSESYIPQRLLELRRMIGYANESFDQKRLNFYKQAKFMADYEDNAAWTGEINLYFPTYSSLNVMQLRGYFTWRTQIKQGIYQKTAAAFAYIYIYELLNGVGATTPEEVLQKLEEFEKNYIQAVLSDTYMRANLHRWMLGYAVMHDIPAHIARRYADSAITRLDNALLALKTPEAYADDDIVEALVWFSDGKIADSPIMIGEDAPGTRLLAAAISYAAAPPAIACAIRGR
ncbi:MAG: TerB N-terminal domain-containing protein, partial [Proteobacteria bacterium]|nr:TerB N-terminal domain-containing protein [Pseudomonadota bacterium]